MTHADGVTLAPGEALASVQGDVNGDGKSDFDLLVKYTGVISASDFVI